MIPIMYGAGSLVLAILERFLVKPEVPIPLIQSIISIVFGIIGFWNPLQILDRLMGRLLRAYKLLSPLRNMSLQGMKNAHFMDNTQEMGDIIEGGNR